MKPKINQLINKSVVRLKRGSPTVLTCLGVAGVVATTVSAVMATPKAIEKIRKDSLINHDGDPCGYSKTEAIRSAWVYYIPSTVIGVSTITCIVGANVLNRHQQASLSSLTYTADGVLLDDMNEIVDDIEEVVGEDSLEHFGEYEDDPVYVRNDAKKCDYEILLDQRNYQEIFETQPHRTEM